jgi:hypothetical protein
MLFERTRCLVPISIRQVEPFLSEVQQVGFVIGLEARAAKLEHLRSAVSILVLFTHKVDSPNVFPSPMTA